MTLLAPPHSFYLCYILDMTEESGPMMSSSTPQAPSPMGGGLYRVRLNVEIGLLSITQDAIRKLEKIILNMPAAFPQNHPLYLLCHKLKVVLHGAVTDIASDPPVHCKGDAVGCSGPPA